jgi:RNA polymerase sigma factor (sigma-70 family)
MPIAVPRELAKTKIPAHIWANRQHHKNYIIRVYVRLARSVAHNFSRQNYEMYDDLEQVALIAMSRAIDSFDYTKDIEFSTYATSMMKGAAQHYLRDNGPTPRVVMGKYKRVVAAQAAMAKLGRSMSLEAVAQSLKINDWAEVEAAFKNPIAVPLDDEHDVFMPDESIDDHAIVRRTLIKMSDADRALVEEFGFTGPGNGPRSPALTQAIERFKNIFLALQEADRE